MLRDSVDSICRSLLSTKIRDRNEALEKLQNISFNLASSIDHFDSISLLKLLESLNLYLESDRSIYEKSNNNTVVEVRLNKASAILRSLIIYVLGNRRFSVLYKPKQSEKIIDILLNHLTYSPVDSGLQIFEPVVLNITKALNHLIRIQSFKDHLFEGTYEVVIIKIIKCLNLVVSDGKQTSANENLIIELFSMFHEFLNPSYTSATAPFTNLNSTKAESYYSQMFEIFLLYFKNVFGDNKRESESIIYTFKIINKCLLDLSTSDIKLCHKFYRLGIQFILEIKVITSRRLIAELGAFINLIPPFICLKSFYKLIDDNWAINSNGKMSNSSKEITTSTRSDKSTMSDVFSVVDASSDAEESIIISDKEENVPEFDASSNTRKRKHVTLDDTPKQQLKDLGKVMELIFSLLLDNSFEKRLKFDCTFVNLHIFPMVEKSKYNWFHFKYISLAKGQSSIPWLLRLGFSRLLIAYFGLKLELDIDSPTSYVTSKKQRIASMKLGFPLQFSDYLQYFENPTDCMISLLVDETFANSSHNIVLSQIFALYLGYLSSNNQFSNIQYLLSNIVENKEKILDDLMNIFEKQDINLKYWVLLAINIHYSISQNYQRNDAEIKSLKLTSNKTFTKLLKYCLELLKDNSMSKLACTFLTHLSIFHFYSVDSPINLDKTIIQQYENVIELSEINGPVYVCKESVFFWLSTSYICKKIKFKNIKFYNSLNVYDAQLFSRKVSNWVQSKFDQLSSLDDFSDIYPILKLLRWILGYGEIELTSEVTNHMENLYDGECLSFIVSNLDQLKLCEYILKNQALKSDNFIDEKSYSLRSDSLAVNDLTRIKVIALLMKFIDMFNDDIGTSIFVNWCIGINSTFEMERCDDLVPLLQRSCSIIKEKFGTYQNNQLFQSVLLSYLMIIHKIPLCETNTLSKIADLVSISDISEIVLHLLNSENGIHTFTEKELDVFDSFMSSKSKDKKWDTFPDYSIYNFKNLYFRCSTLEQKMMHAILKLHTIKSDHNIAAECALKFSSKLTSEVKYMATQYEFLKFMEVVKLPLNEEVLDIMSKFLTSLLVNHLTKTYECAIIIISRLFSISAKVWMKPPDSNNPNGNLFNNNSLAKTCNIMADGKSVHEYLIHLHRKSMLHSELSLVEFLKLSIKINENVVFGINEFEERPTLEVITSCFKLLCNKNKYYVSHDLMLYIKSKKHQRFDIYSKFIRSFKNPQESIESSATFCSFMACISQSSELLIIAIICNLLELSSYQKIRIYLKYTVSQITHLNNIPSSNRLFWNFREVFFKCWESFELSIDQFPYELFDFTSLDDFYLSTYKEIIALSLAYNRNDIISRVSKAIKMKEVSLVKDSMSLSITLSWTAHGIRNKVFKSLDKYFLTKKYLKSQLTEQFLLIVFQLFRLCDCSSETKILQLFDTTDSDLKDLLFSKKSTVLPFLDEYELQVKPQSCIDMIQFFAETCGIKYIWTIPTIYHLTSKLLLLIEASIFNSERKIHFRKLKLLFMLAPEGFENENICELLATQLSKYLSQEFLMNDAAGILTALIEHNRTNLSNIPIVVWVTVICSLFGGPCCENIKKMGNLLLELKDKIKIGKYDKIFKFGLETIEYNNSESVPDLVESIGIVCEDKNHTKLLISYLSLLFEHNSIFQSNKYKIEPSKFSQTFIQHLFDIKNKYTNELSSLMLNWIGRCIGIYYQNSGKYPCFESNEFDSYILVNSSTVNFNKEVKSLDFIFSLMLQEVPASSLRSKYCFETIVGVIINRHNLAPENISSFISYDLLFKSFEQFIYPMNDYMWSLSMEQVETEKIAFYKCNLENALNGFITIIKVYKFEKWLTDILFSIINELSTQSSFIILLSNYIFQIPSFASKCFCPLVLYFIENQPLKRGRLLGKMIKDFFKEDVSKLPKKAVEIFVELSLLIRIGAKNKNDKFVTIFNDVDIPEVIKAAIKIGKNKAALMLFEDYYTTVNIVEKDLLLNNSKYNMILKEIYSSLEDNDLMFGLPIVPELNYGLQILQNNNLKWSEMMFNNAIFESAITWDNTEKTKSIEKITHGMMNMGWSGVSNIMNDYLNEVSGFDIEHNNSDILYEQLWKLNQWDISTSNDCQSENQSIYAILKKINENPYDYKAICDNSIKKLLVLNVSEFPKPGFTKSESLESWARTLSICNLIEQILSLDDSTFELHLKTFNASTKWFNNATINEFENILLSRRAIFTIMANYSTKKDNCFFLDKKLCWLGVVNELHNYNNLMTEKKSIQKAINSSVLLTHIATNKFLNKEFLINRIAKYNLARAFWTQKSDTRFSVQTLKDIIKSDELNTPNEFHDSQITEISTAFLMATLASWCDECKEQTSSTIMKKYIDPISDLLENTKSEGYKDVGLTYHIMGKFCDEQIITNESDTVTVKLKQSIETINNDMKALAKYLKEESVDERKRHAKKDYTRLQRRLKVLSHELETMKLEKNNYIEKAINFYFKSIGFDGHDYIENDIDRFCSLWIEHNDIRLDEKELLALPSFNFVPWNSQLVSRLLDENTIFQDLLRKLIINIATAHPFHTLYLLKSLMVTMESSEDAAALSRGKVAERIWHLLQSSGIKFNVKGIPNILESVNTFADKSISIAKIKSLKKGGKLLLNKLPDNDWWLNTLPTLFFPSPVKNIPVCKTECYEIGKNLFPIIKVGNSISIAQSGVSQPKIMAVTLSNGELQKMLLKANDDLRQDSIMKQVFEKVNKLLWKDVETRKRKLRIRVYNVLPLGPNAGIIEFVPNSIPLIDILRSLHETDELDINTARNQMKEVQNQPKSVRIQIYKDICRKISPNLKEFFFNNFTSPDLWINSRSLYCHGIATTSITGYILGIGDRHCNNILLDKSSGEPIHIDFGVAFDQGKSLPIPETVPFRLTRDIVDGMGVTGVNGIFSKSCEHVLRVLRSNTTYICGILDILKYDPLYDWTLSPLRKKKLQQLYLNNKEENDYRLEDLVKKDLGSQANTAIETVKKKLLADGLSDEAVVRELIREATHPNNLALIFMGWSSFL